jgi:hypothetical protein
MLIVENQDHYDKVVAFAKEVGLYEDPGNKTNTLANRLSYLENYGGKGEDGTDRMRVRLIRDCAPMSFYFLLEQKTADGAWGRVIEGGLLYHGSHDGNGSGAGPTFAVTLDPTVGWSIHT